MLPPGQWRRRMCEAIAPKCCALVMMAVPQSVHLQSIVLLGKLHLRRFAQLAHYCCRGFISAVTPYI